MSRRFVYMVVGNCCMAPTSYTLHRISPSRLFYPRDSPERAAAAGARATTMEAAEAAARARTAAMQAAIRERDLKTQAAMMERGMTAKAALRETVWSAVQEKATKRMEAVNAENARLPAPRMSFSSPGIVMDFALVGQTKDKIVAVDGAANLDDYTRDDWDAPGRAVLYDDASNSVRAQLGVRLSERGRTVPVAVGDNLYFMEEEVVVPMDNNRNMQALMRCPARESYGDNSDLYWYSFSPPPYDAIGTGENDPRPRYPERRDMLGAYAVVGDSHIWASTRIRGTYSMDTASATWSRVSDSPLPFWGHAQYAPEHGLWLGFPNDEWQYEFGDSGFLGAWDLNSGGASAPLQALGVWEGGFPPAPSESFNVRSHLVHLGDGGRFCVAKLYQMYKPRPKGACYRCYNDGVPIEISFAVLTGIEVERCDDDGELRMIKHRSCKYSFGEYYFPHDVL